jgi:hypothetical protein
VLRRRSTLLLVALALAGAACAEEDPVAGPTADEVTAPTGPTATGGTPSPLPSATPLEEPDAELVDGRHFGWVRAVDLEALSIEFDLASFLTGDEANEAAEERGDETPVPNDYYIVDDNPRLRTLGVGPTLEIVLFDWNRCCDETIPAGLDAFAEAIASDEPITVDGSLLYGGYSPYWITIEGGVITRIEEQYLP